MFGGGIDPLAILKKSKKPSEEDAAKEDEPKEKVIPPEVAPKTRTKSDADKLTPAEVAVKTKPSPEVAAKTKPSPVDKEDEDLKPKPRMLADYFILLIIFKLTFQSNITSVPLQPKDLYLVPWNNHPHFLTLIFDFNVSFSRICKNKNKFFFFLSPFLLKCIF